MYKHWQFWFLLPLALLLWLVPASHNLLASQQPPTIFVHGYRGTAESMATLIKRAEADGAATQTLTVTVHPNGKIQFSQARSSDLPAIIQVIFADNIAGERQDTLWLRKVYRKLYQTYGYQQINAVGHSMGAYAVIAAAMGKNPMRINKIMAIAGPYNGILHWNDSVHATTLSTDGRPSIIRPEYQWLLDHAASFQAKSVFNVYGDVDDGSNSDTVVTTNSALSLGYVLRRRPIKYQSQLVSGPHAQHSLLHMHNQDVEHLMLAYLFKK